MLDRDRAHRHVDEALLASQELFGSAFHFAGIGMALVGLDGQWLKVNPALCDLVGYSESELLSLSFQDITYPEDLEADLQQAASLLAGNIRSYAMEKRYIHRDGHLVWILLTVSLVDDADLRPFCFVSQMQDISQAKRAQHDLAEERNLLQAIIEGTGDAIFVKDLAGKYMLVNEAAARAVGKTKAELLGHDLSVITPHDQVREIERHERDVLSTGSTRIYEMSAFDRGEHRIYSVTKSPYRDHQGRIVGLVGVEHDITERRHAEEILQHLAHHDPLTDLPNRLLFEDRLSQALGYASRHHEMVALLFLDLDGFKFVNDTLGHDAGDDLLREVARRLRRVVRDTDTVARLGGDELAIILPNIGAGRNAEAVARTIVETLSAIASIRDHSIAVAVSIGISVYPFDGIEADTLLTAADTAMYRAKATGRGIIAFAPQSRDVA